MQVSQGLQGADRTCCLDFLIDHSRYISPTFLPDFTSDSVQSPRLSMPTKQVKLITLLLPLSTSEAIP